MADTVTISRAELEELRKAKEKQDKYLIDGRKYVIEQSLYVLKAKEAGITVTAEEVQKIYDKKFGNSRK